MKHVLIITEDIVKIQTLSGVLGNLFKTIYISWLKTRLNLTIFLLKPFFKLTIITSDAFKFKSKSTYYYGDQLALVNYAANRQTHLNVASKLLKDIKINFLTTRLAIYLTYDYFIYAHLYQDLLKKIKPDLVITLSSSYHEQIAMFLAKKLKLKTIKFHWLTFIWLNHWLKKFFLKRQFKNITNKFLNQSSNPQPSLKKLNQATFLSLDFYRHLKILSPIYKTLDQKNNNPWLVTDIPNLNSALKNIKLSKANHLYLASFLPKNYQLKPPTKPKKLTNISTLEHFLYQLGIRAALPMIKQGQVISQLYLKATQNLFKLTNPKAVVVVSDIRFCELVLAYQAKKTNTRSLLASPNTMLALDQINSYNTTDIVAVVGQFIKSQLVNINLKPSKIKVVGDPRTENYQQLIKPRHSNLVFNLLNLNSNDKIALLTSFPPTSMIPKPEKKAFFELASKAVLKTKNLKLVIKPHPSETRQKILSDLKEWSITNAIVTDNNQLELVDLLNACSVVLQTWSMTIFEATMMSKPVISINPFKKDYGFFLPIIKDGGAIKVYNQKSLQKWLEVLTNPHNSKTTNQLKKAKKVCARFIKTSDNKAAERIYQLLIN